jgi:hypothetical protein
MFGFEKSKPKDDPAKDNHHRVDDKATINFVAACRRIVQSPWLLMVEELQAIFFIDTE